MDVGAQRAMEAHLFSSWFLAYKRKKLGHLEEGIREVHLGVKEKNLLVETPKGKYLSRRSVLGLEEEEK